MGHRAMRAVFLLAAAGFVADALRMPTPRFGSLPTLQQLSVPRVTAAALPLATVVMPAVADVGEASDLDGLNTVLTVGVVLLALSLPTSPSKQPKKSAVKRR